MDKNIKIEIALGIILVVAFLIGGTFWLQNIKINNQIDDSVAQPAVTAQQNTLEQKATAPSAGPSGVIPKNYSDENVEWYESPKKVTDIQLFKDDKDVISSYPYQVWETGKIRTGDFSGGRILLVSMAPMGPSSGAIIYRFVQKPGDSQLYFLKDYSNDDFYSSFILQADDKENGLLAKKVFPYKNYTYDLRISSLEYPGIIVTPGGQKLKKEDDFPFAGIVDSDGKLGDAYFSGAFFKTDMLRFTFSDPVYGDFYTTDITKINDKNNGLAFAENGFYVKAPDGTFKAYSAAIDLGGEIPQITWNDGTQNTSKYSYKTETGCGALNYVNDVSNKISADNLIQMGTASSGDVIYGYKDPNDKALKDFYAEYQKLTSNGDMVPRYYTEEKSKKLSYDQFLHTYPIFFIKDSFGRIIQFINLHYIFSAGCGKPVIYLYPEQTENVSVQVTPTGGMSVSDPAYGAGWNVTADSQSNITNLADGKTYPYLFWEGHGDSIYKIPQNGFVTSRENLKQTLDEKLTQEGLIQKEVGDFEDFWLPKMLAENKPYYFVTFVSRGEIDKLAPLSISPQPNTVIRVLMDYRGLDNWENVPSFSIKTPQRTGFTAVEWGGVLK